MRLSSYEFHEDALFYTQSMFTLLWGSVFMNIINLGLYTVYVHAVEGQKFIAMNIIMLCYVNYGL